MKRLFFPRIRYADEVAHWSKGRIKGKWPIMGRLYLALGLHHLDGRGR